MKYLGQEQVKGILNDGEWHDAYEFLQFLHSLPPEKTARAYANLDGRKSSRERRKQEPLDKQVYLGKLVIIRKYFSGLMKKKIVEKDGVGLNARYRLMQEPYINE